MRKVILGTLFIILLASCKKNNSAGISSGSWTFKNVTYNDTKGIPGMWGNALVSVTATNTTLGVYPYLIVSDSGTAALTSGTYQATGGHINVQVTDSSGKLYMALPNNTGTINVTVNNSKINLTATAIPMVPFGTQPYSDTSILTFNITQTY